MKKWNCIQSHIEVWVPPVNSVVFLDQIVRSGLKVWRSPVQPPLVRLCLPRKPQTSFLPEARLAGCVQTASAASGGESLQGKKSCEKAWHRLVLRGDVVEFWRTRRVWLRKMKINQFLFFTNNKELLQGNAGCKDWIWNFILNFLLLSLTFNILFSPLMPYSVRRNDSTRFFSDVSHPPPPQLRPSWTAPAYKFARPVWTNWSRSLPLTSWPSGRFSRITCWPLTGIKRKAGQPLRSLHLRTSVCTLELRCFASTTTLMRLKQYRNRNIFFSRCLHNYSLPQ